MTTDPLRIALISDHASPLAAAGGVDAGGQNVYVAHVAQELAAAGHQVDVLTRRDSTALPAVVHPWRGVRVLHIEAGPQRFVPKEQLLEHMPAFAETVRRLMRAHEPYVRSRAAGRGSLPNPNPPIRPLQSCPTAMPTAR